MHYDSRTDASIVGSKIGPRKVSTSQREMPMHFKKTSVLELFRPGTCKPYFKTFPPFVYAQAIAAAAAPSSSCTAARSRTAWPATATTRWPPRSRPRPSSTPRGTPSPTRCRGTRPWSWSTRRTRGRTSSRYVREHFDALSFPRSLAICYHFFFPDRPQFRVPHRLCGDGHGAGQQGAGEAKQPVNDIEVIY